MMSPAFWNDAWTNRTWTNEAWTAALINHLWQSTLVVLIAWLLALALRSNQAGTRYWVWMIASVKFLIPFSLLIAAGESLRTAVATPIQRPAFAAVMEQITQPFSQTTSAADHLGKAPLVPGHYSNPLSIILVAVWSCGFLAIVFSWVRGWWKIRAAVRASLPMQITMRITMSNNVPVLSSPRLLEPGVFGIVCPVLLLPESISDRLSAPQLSAIIAHELCHIRRRDNLTAAIHMLVVATFSFHPAVWWIRARLLEERERACDEAVLQSGNEAEVYAEGILSVCRFYVESPLECASGISGSDLKTRIARIMTQAFARRLTLSRKILLATIGLAVIVLPIAFGLLDAIPSRAQSQAQDTNPAAHVYEVASIKPNKSGDNMTRMMIKPDGLSVTGATLDMLVQDAYGVRYFQISGSPGWFKSERYDIEAKTDSSVVEELRKLSDDQREAESRRMLQALLADRFQLKLHSDTKELPVYTLVIAKNGPKLQVARPGDTYPNGFKGPDGGGGAGMMFMEGNGGPVKGQGIPIASLVHLLSQQLGRTVLDKTGLTGKYDFTLQWTPDEAQGPPGLPGIDNAPPPESLGPSIFTAIQEQLGLKLESQKGPVEILVIDHAERPSEN
jgi:bla regulator protein BlaR1